MAFWSQSEKSNPQHTPPGLSQVRFVIAVASGKGGVGKSTLSTNLAFALKQYSLPEHLQDVNATESNVYLQPELLREAKVTRSNVNATKTTVGLLDADIYGPSQPGMLGAANAHAEAPHGELKPVLRHGIPFISMGLLAGPDAPVIWRAPMAMKIIQQFLMNVSWGKLDYVIMDLPPGTGDVQLTLAQQASLTGVIIVTTPQDVALGIAKKGLKMFEQVNVPILGIVENMSGFHCPHCGKPTAVFKEGGAKEMAESLKIPFLGAIPLDPEIMSCSDEGVPILLKHPESASAQAYLSLAKALKEKLEYPEGSQTLVLEPQHVELLPNNKLQVYWPDGHQSLYSAYNLRINCLCAMCVDENSGRKVLDTKKVPLDIQIKTHHTVGRYALAFHYSDGHSTGIYPHKKLRELCECELCMKEKKQDLKSFSV